MAVWERINIGNNARVNADWTLSQQLFGLPRAEITCGEGEKDIVMMRCHLLLALQNKAWSEVAALQKGIMQADQADLVTTLGKKVQVPFYDVTTLYIVAIADLQSAIELFKKASSERNNDQVNLLSARAALLLRDVSVAESVLRGSSNDNAIVKLYRGIIRNEQGHANEGAQLIRQARSQNQSVSVLWAELASLWVAPDPAVETYLERVTAAQAQDVNTVRFLAMAALRVGRPDLANRYLSDATSTADRTVERVGPAVLILMARALLELGEPKDFKQVLGYLFEVSKSYPQVAVAYDLTQRYYSWILSGDETIPRFNND